MPKEAYACKNKNRKDRLISSSGGIYYLIASYVLRNNGVVFSAVYSHTLTVCHQEINTKEELKDSVGAKYVSSNLGDSFSRIKEYLSRGKLVLFVGTPCQCFALRKVIGNDYSGKLICVDFVCHGVPASLFWHAYLDSMKKRGLDIVKVNMRNKLSGWSRYRYCWKIETKDGKKYYQMQSDNTYMKAFLNNIILKETCYSCAYKSMNTNSDITLGDCWGIWERYPSFDDNQGISLIFVNSKTGRDVFKEIKGNINCIELKELDYLPYNPSINTISKKPDYYNTFITRFHNGEDFCSLVSEFLFDKKEYKYKIFLSFIPYIIKNKIKFFLKRLFG